MRHQGPIYLFSLLFMLWPAVSRATEATLTRDAYTSSVAPTTNFGTAATIRVSLVERAWLSFDVLSILPPGTVGDQVAHATLKLWANTVTTPRTFDVHRIDVSWSQGSITHANAPPVGSLEASAVPVPGRSFVTVDLTTLVRDWVDGATNEGIALVRTPGSGLSARFDSMENTGTSHEARLDITLNLGDGVPTGTMIFSDGGGCPPGYTMVTAYNDRFLVASDTPGRTGGSNSHSHGPGSYSSAASGGSHTHAFRAVISNAGGIDPDNSTTGASAPGTSGGGSIAGASAAAAHVPEFVTITLCRRN